MLLFFFGHRLDSRAITVSAIQRGMTSPFLYLRVAKLAINSRAVYPNPVTGDRLTVEATQLDGRQVHFSLTNMLGQELLSGSETVNNGLLNISNLQQISSGNYLLTLTVAEKRKVFKIVK